MIGCHLLRCWVDEPDKRRKSSERPVTITALPLDIPLSFAFFSCVREGNISGAGAFFGVSVFWTMQLFETALHLVSTERYLPSLVRGTTQWQGCWMPYPENAVASWLDTLTEIKDDCSAGNFRFFFNSRSA